MPQENSDSRVAARKIIDLERSTGFRDEAVTGGLEAFVARSLPEASQLVAGYAGADRSHRERMLAALVRFVDTGRVPVSDAPVDVPGDAAPSSARAAGEAISPSTPISRVKGIGAKRSELLAKLGIRTIEDLLFYFPRRLEDRTAFAPIGSLRGGEQVCVRGRIEAIDERRTGRRMTLIKAAVGDGTGFLYAVWFNQPWLAKQLRRGDTIDLYGAVERNYRELQMKSPVWEPEGAGLEMGRWVPVYPATEGISDRYLRSLIDRHLDSALQAVDDLLPNDIVDEHGLLPRRFAVESIHRPIDADGFERARRTLAFEELYLLQIGLAATAPVGGGRAHRPKAGLVESFLAGLPFTLTAAQHRASNEILADLKSPTRMMRLLQGDVGSGKTLVSLVTALAAIDGGCQVAFMAPTEILAEQHALTCDRLLAELPVRASLLTGATKGKDAIRKAAAAGEIDLLVGTHALIQESVEFRDLGLVVVDEQHRFGVVQRSQIEDKGERVDMLVMSATPIPRTITLTLYGEFDVSVLDELPLGPRDIETRAVPEAARGGVLDEVGGFLDTGRKGYVVLPLVEESENVTAKAAVQVAEELAARFPNASVGLIHGRLSPTEKAAVMDRFHCGDVRLLVATTVIEVGIDVPDADFLVIEHADRFGLSQLHQLRGRIGRSGQRSICWAIADATTEQATERLAAFVAHDDGFAIAEDDLRIRGPGDLLGTQQSGFFSQLRAVDLLADLDLMRHARDAARRLEGGPERTRLEQAARRRFSEVLQFLRV